MVCTNGGVGYFGETHTGSDKDPTSSVFDGRWLTEITSSENFDGTKLKGTSSGWFITDKVMGDISGNFLGVVTSGTEKWAGVSIGTWVGDTLVFGDNTQATGVLYYNNNGSIASDSNFNNAGHLGFTLAGSNNYNVLAMGPYANTSNRSGIWNSVIDGDPDSTNHTTPSYLDGYMGGLWNASSNNLEGSVYVLHSKNGSAGILYGDFSKGINSTGISMWGAKGTTTHSEVTSTWNTGNASLTSGSTITGTLYGDFGVTSGTFDQNDDISGVLSSSPGSGTIYYTYNDVQQGFGLMRLFFGYNNPTFSTFSGRGSNTTWSADITGTGDFGAYYNDGLQDLSGVYYKVDIDGGSWTADGEITANESAVNGMYYANSGGTGSSIGIIRGGFYGTTGGHADKWVGQLIARWQLNDFTGFNWGGTSLYRYADESILRVGSDPADIAMVREPDDRFYFLAMGDYTVDGTDEGSYLQHSKVLGHDGVIEGSGRMEGYIGTLWKDGDTDGMVNSVYITDDGRAGILSGDVNGFFSRKRNRWNAPGYLDFTAVESGIDTATAAFYEEEVILTGSGSSSGSDIIANASKGASVSKKGETWGIWQNLVGGSVEGTISDNWDIDLKGQVNNTQRWVSVGIEQTNNTLNGNAAGAWVNWDQAVTGVMGGKLKGVFDPASTTWQAAAAGAWLDTNRFLELTATAEGQRKLQQLNIPFIEIGRANLAGRDAIMNVNMNDVTFFAYSNGARPKIWATNGVNGTYQAQPNQGHTVGLTGNGLNAAFKVNNWNNQTWGATVNGAGALNRNTGGTVNVQFNGAAAGTHKNGQFSGTGAGAVK